MTQEIASMVPIPEIKSAWLSIQCWPDEKTPALMRLKIDLELNGEKHSSMIDTVFDPKSGNGVICQGNALTWMFRHTEEFHKLQSKLVLATNTLNEAHRYLCGSLIQLSTGKCLICETLEKLNATP